jgi:cytochrome c-type biogenesis protein CcmH/NrfG
VDLETLRAGARATPKDAAAWDRLAAALVLGETYGEAASAYLEAWALEPSPGRAQNLGNCYMMMRQPADAERCFREAIRLAPGSSDAHFSLAYALYYQKRLKEAVAELDLGLKLDPNNSAAAKLKEQILR